MGSFSDLARTTVSGNITSSVATIPVASTARFDSNGYLNIEDELISYTGKTSTSFTGCTRGVGYPVVTAQAGHLDLVLVRAVVTAAQLLAMIQNPMANPGDTIMGGTAGAATAVAKGADGMAWKVDPSTHLPAWLSGGVTTILAGTGIAVNVASGDVTVSATAVVPANVRTASYVLVLGDAGLVIEMNVAGANTLTIPPNSSVAFAVGTILEVFQLGAGQCTITPGAGVTLRSDGAKTNTAAQYASISLRKRATDEWVLAGDLT